MCVTIPLPPLLSSCPMHLYMRSFNIFFAGADLLYLYTPPHSWFLFYLLILFLIFKKFVGTVNQIFGFLQTLYHVRREKSGRPRPDKNDNIHKRWLHHPKGQKGTNARSVSPPVASTRRSEDITRAHQDMKITRRMRKATYAPCSR